MLSRCQIALALIAVVALTGGLGCSSQDEDGEGAPTVYAASSLRDTLPQIELEATYSFAASQALRTQIERGAPADVFVAAEAEQTQALFRAGRCERPLAFAANEIVLLVPRSQPAPEAVLAALERGGLRLAVGASGSPIGDYTRELLGRLGLSVILSRNTVSLEANAAGLTAKVALGSADAAFAYLTDGRLAADRVRTLRLPRRAQPPIRYEACAVRRPGAKAEAARAFIDRLNSDAGRRVLREAGFLPPPGEG